MNQANELPDSFGADSYVSGRTSYRPKHPKCSHCKKRHDAMLLCYPFGDSRNPPSSDGGK